MKKIQKKILGMIVTMTFFEIFRYDITYIFASHTCYTLLVDQYRPCGTIYNNIIISFLFTTNQSI